MILLDLLHSIFVLVGSGSYLLPLWEGVQRKSIFYTTLFSLLLVFSIVLHGEETGLTEPLNENLHNRLKSISQGLTYYLFNVMILVVLEIRSEIFGRSVVAFWSLIIYFFPLSSFSYAILITFILSIIILIIDVAMHSRKFTTAYWRRLGLIAVMALIGAGFFRILHWLWLWHGIGHFYASIATYLLLLAQRTKQKLSSGKAYSGGGSSSSISMGSNRGNGSSSTYDSSTTTPMKRKTTTTSNNPENSSSNSNINLKEDGAIASALPLSPNVQQRGNKGTVINHSNNFTDEGPIPV